MASDMVEGFPGSPGRDNALTAGVRQQQAREVAELQTKYFMAEQFPRDERRAMDRIEVAFQRASLAELSTYQYARGATTVTGATIRTLEACALAWQNIEQGVREVARGMGVDGVGFSEVESYAVDLQSRGSKRSLFIVRHWRDTKQGGYRLTDERDIFELISNQASRRLRGCLQAIIPGDVVEHALEIAGQTLTKHADVTPAALAKMLESFAAFGVSKDMIERRIQRRLDAITPAQVVGMKRIYASLRDGVGEARDWFDVPDEQRPPSTSAEVVKAATRGRPRKSPPPPDEGAAVAADPPPPRGPAPGSTVVATDAGPLEFTPHPSSLPLPVVDPHDFFVGIQRAPDRDEAALILDRARTSLTPENYATARELFGTHWGA